MDKMRFRLERMENERDTLLVDVKSLRERLNHIIATQNRQIASLQKINVTSGNNSSGMGQVESSV